MKSLISLLVSLSIIFSLALPVFAHQDDTAPVFLEDDIMSVPFIDSELVGTTLQSDVMPLDYYNEIPRVTETYKVEETIYVTPDGQPSLGYEGGSGAFVVFFSTGGSSVNFTVTVGGEIFEFTAETGSTTSYGQGYGDHVPSAPGRYRFEFIKYYVITIKKVDVYQYSQYKYTYYVSSPQYSLSHRWVLL